MSKQVTQFSPSGRRLLTTVKQPIDTYATANVDVVSPPAAINGRTLVAEDRLLLMGQTDPDDNGLYGFDGTELQRAVDWLNEEGQLVEVLNGSFRGQLLAFVGGAWNPITDFGSGPLFYATLAAVRADPVLLTTHAAVYVAGKGLFVWSVGGDYTRDLGNEFSSVIALPGDTTGAYLLDAPVQLWKPPVYALSTVNVDLASLPATIGGASKVTNARYLLVNQTTGSENGTYVYNGTTLVKASDFTSAINAFVVVTQGTWANRVYTYSLSTWLPLGPGPFAYPDAATVRLDYTLIGYHPPIYVNGIGNCVWRTFAAGGNYGADTGTEQTSFIALTGDNTGAYCAVNGQLYYKPTAIGTGSAWVTLLSITEPANNGDQLDVSYAVRGYYGSVTFSFVRARGIVAVVRSFATTTIAATGTTFSDPRVQVIYSGGSIVIQAQQHATENWVFQADASFVRT